MFGVSVTQSAQANARLTLSGSGNLAVHNNITLGGTVDGRDVASDGTKLDGIESNATADQTASEIVSLLSDQDIATTGTVEITSDQSNPSLLIKGAGPNFIRFLDTGGTTDSIDVTFRTSSHRLQFEQSSDASVIFSLDVDDNQATFTGNVDVGSGIDVTGDITTSGDLTINSTRPRITLNDTDSESDFEIKNENGSFRIRDIDNPTDRYKINTSGTVHEFLGSAGFSSTLNVVSNITVGGTVDGRDLATDGSKLDGIESGATADQTKSDIDALGIAASTATTLATARTIAGVSFDGSANISLNNNAITNGAGYLTSVGTSNIDDGAVTNAKVNASAAIAGTKIDPNFGTQNVNTSGSVACGNITISNVNPKIFFTDTNNDSDFSIKNNNGVFSFTDQTNSADRFTIASDGTVDVAGNLDVGAGIDVTGDAAVSGSVTAPRISGSNGILEMKQEIGTSQTLTSGYNAIAVDPTIANGVTITVPSGAIWSIV